MDRGESPGIGCWRSFATKTSTIAKAIWATTTATLNNILIRTHWYWIREADIDGFRVEAVTDMGELASPSDEIIDRDIGQNTRRQAPG